MSLAFGAPFGLMLFILGVIVLFSEKGRQRILNGYTPGGYGTFIIRGLLPFAVAEIFMGLAMMLAAFIHITGIGANSTSSTVLIVLFLLSTSALPLAFTTVYFSWPRRLMLPIVRDLEPEFVLPWSWWAREQKRIQNEARPLSDQEDS